MKKERMNKRLFALALAIVTTAAMSFTSFAAGPAAPKEKLPEFRFTNEAPYMNAILDYMTDSERNGYEAGDVMIPNFVILKEDLQ